MHNYSFTSEEDQVLLDMFQFFDDLGLPEHFKAEHYETLENKYFGADVNNTSWSVDSDL